MGEVEQCLGWSVPINIIVWVFLLCLCPHTVCVFLKAS